MQVNNKEVKKFQHMSLQRLGGGRQSNFTFNAVTEVHLKMNLQF